MRCMFHRSLVAMTVVGAVILAGCSTSSSSGGSAGAGQSTGSLTINWVSQEQVGLRPVLAAFEKANPGIHVSVTYLANDDLQARTRTELAAGTGPDITFVNAANGNPLTIDQLAQNGYLSDLSSQPWVSQIPEAIRGATQVDGKTLYLPMSVSQIGILLNMATLKQVGGTVPTTYSGVLQLCQEAVSHGKFAFNDASGDIFAIMLPYALVATNVYAHDAQFDKQQQAGKASFSTSAGYRQSLDQLVQMNKAGCFGRGAAADSLASAENDVANGSSVGAIQISGAYGGYVSVAPHADLKAFPMPATNDPSETRISAGAGGGAALNSKSNNKKLAIKLIDFMATQPMERLYAAGLGGAEPALPGSGYQASPTVSSLVTLYNEDKVGPLLDQNWPNPEVQQVLLSGIQSLLNGSASVSTVLSEMDAAYAKGDS